MARARPAAKRAAQRAAHGRMLEPGRKQRKRQLRWRRAVVALEGLVVSKAAKAAAAARCGARVVARDSGRAAVARDSSRAAVARAAGADALKTELRLKAVASNSHRTGGWWLVGRGSCARDGRTAECTRENASLAPAAPTKKSGCDLRTVAQRSMYAHEMHLYAGHETGGCKVQGQLHPPAVCLNEAESHARLKVLLTLRCCARTCRACSAVCPATSTASQVLVGS